MTQKKEPLKPADKIFFENKPGFRVTSGIKLVEGELKEYITDYSVFTDEYQGIAWYKHGLQRLVCNGCSYETVGVGEVQKNNLPAKLIAAASGHIVLEAQDGDVLIKGRNIRFQAEEELTLSCTGIINLDSSTLHCKSTNTNILTSQGLTMGANFVKNEGGTSVESGTKADSKKGGFLGRLLNFATNPLN